ncbi:MAG: glycoside hydrolase family 2, partial [Prevotellaceae bacterium]|nr:glycoside hydrolase family 2 [Prevotellaceae bacterium]
MLSSGCSGDFSAIEQGFVSPPDSIRIGVYWYWINDNISKEAVVKDLHAMKQAGISRAFIGNIGQQSYPVGKVKILSDEWWEVIHTALKTASELDIEIGIFNSPGWSQSGGPWIKPEQSMRYLATSELRAKGPAKIEQKLPKPETAYDFQDEKVIAFPVSDDYRQNLFSVPGARTVSGVFTENPTAAQQVRKSEGKHILPAVESFIGLVLPKAYTARSLEISACGYVYANAELQVKDGGEFKAIKRFVINRTNPGLNVGFVPYAPIVISLPEVTASEYRIVFSNASRDCCISNIALSGTPVTERYPEKTLAKMFQSPLPYWHDYLWDKQPDIQSGAAAALAKPEQVLDISKYMAADGTLSWDVPEGEWLILRTGMTSTGVTNSPASIEGTGLEVDKMNKKHVATHFDAFLGKILERVPPEDRKTWKMVVEDSYETGSQNFTDGFFDDFKARYGYDALPFIPAFYGHVIGSPDLSDRFLWDLRRMIADKVSYDYVGGLREISNKHGLATWLENYGHWGFPGEFLQYGGQSDEIGGEFWSEGNLGDIENRAASSCAHIYGKTKVSAESFTCGGNAYARYPAVMKRRGDWSFTEGINSTLLHVYIQQAYDDRYPGIDEWFGNEFNRKNTWFKHIDLFTLYLKRCNFMLQQGLNVADAAYFIGEDAPKMTGIRDPEIPKGYSFDYINAEVIVRDLSV